jgi:hypothetical protein
MHFEVLLPEGDASPRGTACGVSAMATARAGRVHFGGAASRRRPAEVWGRAVTAPSPGGPRRRWGITRPTPERHCAVTSWLLSVSRPMSPPAATKASRARLVVRAGPAA